MATGGEDLERVAERLRALERRDLEARPAIRGGAFLGAGRWEERWRPAEAATRRAPSRGRPGRERGEPRRRPRRQGGPVNWLSWPGHNDPSFIQPFTDETGITVKARSTPAATTCSRSRRPRLRAPTTSSRRMPSTSPAQRGGPARADGPVGVPGARRLPGRLQARRRARARPRARRRRVRPDPAFRVPRPRLQLDQVTEEEAQSYDILFDPKVAGKIGWFDWWAHMGPIGLYEGAKGSWWPAGELDPTTSTRRSSRRWWTPSRA